MKYLLGICIVLLLMLQYRLWVDEDGIREVWRLKQEVETHRREIALLQERNNALAAEVIDLKSGLGAIEERARTDLGMVKKGETFYHLIGNESDADAQIQRSQPATSEQ